MRHKIITYLLLAVMAVGSPMSAFAAAADAPEAEEAIVSAPEEEETSAPAAEEETSVSVKEEISASENAEESTVPADTQETEDLQAEEEEKEDSLTEDAAAVSEADVEAAKKTREYGLDAANHPNWFDASYISWLSYDAMHIELPDGYLYFLPIINWGKYREENGRLMMPVSVRLNHAVADGYLVANVFRLLEKEMGILSCSPCSMA